MIRMSINVGGGKLMLEKTKLRAVMRGAGGEVAAIARALIRRSGGGKRNKKRGAHSLPGQPPFSQSGNLARKIVVRPFNSGEGVAIRDTAFYALFLQAGARGGGGNTRDKANILRAGETNWRGKVLRSKNRMKKSAVNRARILEPRPFLTTALELREASIGERVKGAITDGIKFQRMKASL